MAANIVIPDAFKSVKPYLTLATQLEQKNEKVVGYYCRLYAVQTGMSINKSAPDCKKFLIQQMDVLEKTKVALKNDESISSEIVGQACVEKYALGIFNTADADDRASKFTKNLVKQFYTAGLLFDALNCFGELSDDLVVKKDYAKKKAMYLNKCFQSGETPIPGPLIQSKDEDEFSTDDGANAAGGYQYNDSYQAPHQPSTMPTMPSTTPSQPSPSKQQTQNYEQETKPSGKVDGEIILQAQKLCKFAQSALQYDDVETAVDNLEKCLRILKSK